jgi:hypothetical protein
MSDIGRFKLIAYPKLRHRPDGLGKLSYVEFFASRDGEVNRVWRVEDQKLDSLFDILESPELVTNIICNLRHGTSVALPGDYSAVHLVLLGFRVPFKKPPQPASVPSSVNARFIQG